MFRKVSGTVDPGASSDPCAVPSKMQCQSHALGDPVRTLRFVMV